MKKDNYLLVGLLGIIIVIALICGFFAFQNMKKETKDTDAIKIQKEYNELNGKVNESNKKEYPIVNLSDDNPFIYKTEEEIVKILESGTGIIYFGFKNCPWCRTMLPILESAAKEENIGEIYYLDILDIRSTLSLDENNKVVTEKEGSNDYYKILDLLKENLNDYTFTGSNGKTISTGEKRLYAPTVVAVQNGVIKAFHEGTVNSQKDGYDTLSEEAKDELKNIFKELVTSINYGICTEGC